MAATSSNTRSLSPEKHRRKKKKNRPEAETDVVEETDNKPKGKWKVADVDYGALKLDELREFMGLEELSSADHEVIIGKPSDKRSRNRKRRLRKRKLQEAFEQVPSVKKKKVAPTHPAQVSKQDAPNATSPKKGDEKAADAKSQSTPSPGSHAPSRKPSQKKGNPQKTEKGGSAKPRVAKDDRGGVATDTQTKTEASKVPRAKGKSSSFTKGIPVPKKDTFGVDVSAWKALHISGPVLEALRDLGFSEPTPIQTACIPPAVKDGKDVVGAAETGSGKTLAFGIPVIHSILQHRAALQREARSKAYKEASLAAIAETKPVVAEAAKPVAMAKARQESRRETPTLKGEARAAKKNTGVKTHPTREGKTAGRPAKGKIRDKGKKMEARFPKEEEEEDEDDFDDDADEEDFDDDEDGDIEYNFDDDESDDFSDQAEQSDDQDEDVSDSDEEEAEDEEASEDEDDSDEEADEEEEDAGSETDRAAGKPKSATDSSSSSAVQPPKRRRGKKVKRKFRVHERKLLALDGEEFEGVELINKMEKRGFGCVRAIDDISEEEMMAQMGLESLGMAEGEAEAGRGSAEGGQLHAMILMPTRELAVQVKNHLTAVTKYTDIKVAVIVGGMSAQKQERVLRKQPEIVVGTPGRIWELFREGEPHLSTMGGVRCLVLDEADRMVERGHYEQLTEILHQMNRSPASLQRQTFVFSATLTHIHQGPDRKTRTTDKKKTPKQEKKDRKNKLNNLMNKVGIREDPIVVDLTQKQGTVASLMEAKIICDVADKDIYLYYFLLQFPGRTLVFCNSIDCIRRLCSILTLLACNPLPLHSSMHQKQRLKNLDRFAANPKALLLATDVAARGLDIPDVEHVIHYQVPRTSETYIHRSGRTARQAKEGVSIMLVSSSEANFYRRVCKTLNRDDIASFPVDHMYYNAVKERVDQARQIDQLNHRVEKKKHSNDWFIKAAKELDVDLDEDLVLHDLGDSRQQMEHNRNLQMMKDELRVLLKQKIRPRGSSWLYPTAEGKLLSPLAEGSTRAFSMVKRKVANKSQVAGQVVQDPPKKVKKSKNKFKPNVESQAT